MKPLLTYIEEARETIGKLPFTLDQFRKFLAVLADFEDDSEDWKVIEDAVRSAYGENVWRGFMGWCEGTQYKTEAKDMYEILKNMPKDRIERVLGAGSYGAAVMLANGKVCKIFHKNRDMERTDRKFFEYCMTHKTNVFPTIHKLGKKFVVMDKLAMNTPKCKMYDSYLKVGGKKFNGMDIEQIAKQVIKKNNDINKVVAGLDAEAKEVLDWSIEALTRLEEAVGFDSFSDMRLSNIGERKDGAIIWFDI